MKNVSFYTLSIVCLFLAFSLFALNRPIKENTRDNCFFETDSCEYCQASGGGEEYIDGVEIGTIVNLGNGYQSYSDYTNLSTEVIAGMTYTMIVYTESVFFDDDYGVWIDWNQDCEFDNETENVVCEINNGQDIHYFDIEVPAYAIPGLTTMRIRLKFAGSDCGSPCDSTLWGEVEDYSLNILNQGYGALEGCITNCITGSPLGGAIIDCGPYSAFTGADGCYAFELLPESYNIFCSYAGFCFFDTTITIIQGSGITLDIALCPAQLEVSSDTIYISLYHDEFTNLFFTIFNTGNCDIDYDAGADVGWLGNPITISGTLYTGDGLEIGWPIGTDDLLPGWYEGNIIFESNSISSPDSIHVILEVLGYDPPVYFSFDISCTDFCLGWEMPPGSNPSSFNIYRDGELIANITEYGFCEYNVMPEVEYCYHVTAVYESGESMPTPELCITVPTPANLEPYDLEAIIHYPNDFDVTLIWEEPTSCLIPDGYNIYRNYVQINDSLATELNYIDEALIPDYYDYYVTAVYYFGESDPSNSAQALLSGIDDLGTKQYNIFPNPARSLLNIQSDFKVKSVQMYDNKGQIIFAENPNQKNIQIDVSQFEPGIYFMQLEIEEKTILRKIIVE